MLRRSCVRCIEEMTSTLYGPRSSQEGSEYQSSNCTFQSLLKFHRRGSHAQKSTKFRIPIGYIEIFSRKFRYIQNYLHVYLRYKQCPFIADYAHIFWAEFQPFENEYLRESIMLLRIIYKYFLRNVLFIFYTYIIVLLRYN